MTMMMKNVFGGLAVGLLLLGCTPDRQYDA